MCSDLNGRSPLIDLRAIKCERGLQDVGIGEEQRRGQCRTDVISVCSIQMISDCGRRAMWHSATKKQRCILATWMSPHSQVQCRGAEANR